MIGIFSSRYGIHCEKIRHISYCYVILILSSCQDIVDRKILVFLQDTPKNGNLKRANNHEIPLYIDVTITYDALDIIQTLSVLIQANHLFLCVFKLQYFNMYYGFPYHIKSFKNFTKFIFLACFPQNFSCTNCNFYKL